MPGGCGIGMLDLYFLFMVQDLKWALLRVLSRIEGYDWIGVFDVTICVIYETNL